MITRVFGWKQKIYSKGIKSEVFGQIRMAKPFGTNGMMPQRVIFTLVMIEIILQHIILTPASGMLLFIIIMIQSAISHSMLSKLIAALHNQARFSKRPLSSAGKRSCDVQRYLAKEVIFMTSKASNTLSSLKISSEGVAISWQDLPKGVYYLSIKDEKGILHRAKIMVSP